MESNSVTQVSVAFHSPEKKIFSKIKSWSIWEVPNRLLVFIFMVEIVWATLFARALLDAPSLSVPDITFMVVAISAILFISTIELKVGVAGAGSDDINKVQHDGWFLATALLCPLWMAMVVPLVILSIHFFECMTSKKTGRSSSEVHYKIIFNLTLWSIAAASAHSVAKLVGGIEQGGLHFMAAAVAAAVVMCIVGVGGVFIIVSAIRKVSLLKVIREERAYFIEYATVLGLGIIAAATWQFSSLVVIFIVPLLTAFQRSLLHQHLLEQSRTDAKTGLTNAEFWRQNAESHVTRAAGGGPGLSILILDLDHFKQVNDTYGHLSGDDVLQEVARRLRTAVRPGDLVGRFGGEEFVVLLPGAGLEQAMIIAERIRFSIEKDNFPVFNSPTPIPVTASIGVASVECRQQTALPDVLEISDKALYIAKSTGRNRVVAGDAAVKEVSII